MTIKLLALFLSLFLFVFVNPAHARRITPEDVINTKKGKLNAKVANYSNENKLKLEKISEKISNLNKEKTDGLDRIMIIQAQILDGHQKRLGKETEHIEKARYWITYAHEAVAYQAAKIYVFELSSEANLKSDMLSTISLFQNELNSTSSKIIKSQNILRETVK